MKPISDEVKAELAKAKPYAHATLAVEKLREIADKIEKNPDDLQGFDYGVDPYSNDEPRFEAFTVRLRFRTAP